MKVTSLLFFCIFVVPPRLHVEPSDSEIVARAGATVALRCKVTSGNPAPSMEWRKVNDRLPAGAETRDQDQTLTMTSVGRHHSGVYECTAANGVGEPAKAAVTLKVLCKYGKVIVRESVDRTSPVFTQILLWVFLTPASPSESFFF